MANSRPKRASDELRNARRRYERESERYLNKAKDLSGAQAERYRNLAKQSAEKAINLYDQEKYRAKASARFEERFGSAPVIDENQQGYERKDLISGSYAALEGAKGSVENRRTIETSELLKTNFGHSFYGGLVDVWEGDWENRDERILQHFFGDDWENHDIAEVIELMENQIPDVYRDDLNERENYDMTKQKIALLAEQV